MSSPFVTDELVQLQKEITANNPVDILQFCANYFNAKLEHQRNSLWQQQKKAKDVGIVLFPKTDNVTINPSGSGSKSFGINDRQPSFKSPFGDNDPHLILHQQDRSDAPPAPSSGIFKGGFAVASSSNSNPIKEPIDPNDPSTPSGTQISAKDPSDPHSTIAKAAFPGAGTDTGSGAAVGSSSSSSSSSSSKNKIPIAFNANRRTSVSAEALNPDKFKDESWQPPINDLSVAQKVALNRTLAQNFLFKQLDEKSKKTVIQALSEKKFSQGSEIIKQGDEGDYFYIIEMGSVDFYVNGSKVSSSGPGSSFGELALMYNSPRAATAIASSESVTCWALDRTTFRRILLQRTFSRRLMYEDFLKDVKVLSILSDYDRSKLADALLTENYHKGDKIVTEGEKGENFYFIENGTCQVFRESEGVIKTLSKGDYFGEVALLNDLPRQATVEALDNVTVATLDKSGFSRLLGPAVEVLKSQDPTH